MAVAQLRSVVTNDPQFSITLNLHALRGSGATGAEAMRRLDAVGNRVFTGPLLHGAYRRVLGTIEVEPTTDHIKRHRTGAASAPKGSAQH